MSLVPTTSRGGSSITTPVSIADGGTDATTVADAITNLGIIDYRGDGINSGSIPNMSLVIASSTVGALTSGTPRGTPLWLPEGFVVNSLTFSANNALVGATNQFFALCDDDAGSSSGGSARARLAVSADDGATAWGTGAAKTLAMTTPYTTTRAGYFYAVVLVVAATPPQICGNGPSNAGAAMWGTPKGGNSSSTGLSAIPATGLGAFSASNVKMTVVAQ